MSYLATFGLEFQKIGTQYLLFGYCLDRIFKNYCHIWNCHPQICQIAKFRAQNSLNLGRKMLYLGIFRLTFYLTNYCDILKSAPSNLYDSKILRKNKDKTLAPKMPYWVFFNKNALFEYFWRKIFKETTVII